MIWVGLAMAGIAFEGPLQSGVEVVVLVEGGGTPRRGETVRVIHRPGTAHERERAIGITDGRGRVSWTPEEGGIAIVRAGDETERVAIAHAGVGIASDPRATTWLAAILVGLTGIGALIAGFRRRRRR